MIAKSACTEPEIKLLIQRVRLTQPPLSRPLAAAVGSPASCGCPRISSICSQSRASAQVKVAELPGAPANARRRLAFRRRSLAMADAQ